MNNDIKPNLEEINRKISNDNTKLSSEINNELSSLLATIQACKKELKKNTIFYDKSLGSRLVSNLRNLISFKITNWDLNKLKENSMKPSETPRNAKIYELLILLVEPGLMKKHIDDKRVAPYARGLDHFLSLSAPHPDDAIVKGWFYMIATVILFVPNRISDMKKIIVERDEKLYKELQDLHKEVKEYCEPKESGGRRRRKSKKARKSKGRKSRKNGRSRRRRR